MFLGVITPSHTESSYFSCFYAKLGVFGYSYFTYENNKLTGTSSTLTLKEVGKKEFGRYLDLSCVVDDNQPQENDCRKAYQAF